MANHRSFADVVQSGELVVIFVDQYTARLLEEKIRNLYNIENDKRLEKFLCKFRGIIAKYSPEG